LSQLIPEDGRALACRRVPLNKININKKKYARKLGAQEIFSLPLEKVLDVV